VRRLTWLVLLWLSAGCAGGTETGNPSFTGSLGYDAYSSAPAVVGLRAALSSLNVTSAWLVLGDVDFVRCDDKAAAAEHVHGLGAGDHAGEPVPPTSFELAAGRYCGVRLPVMPDGTLPDDAPASLTNHSIVIQGSLPDGRTFELDGAVSATSFSLRASGEGFELDGGHAGVLIGFDVAKWLDGVDFSTATESDGRVLVDETHNAKQLEAFDRNMPSGITLFRDSNRDGVLDTDRVPLATYAP
jgi:hypothetical protein